MLHVSLMPSWKGLEPLYLVSHGSFTNLKKDILFHFVCVILGRACWLLFCRCCQFICHSEGPPEETSLRSSMEPPCFNRWKINPNTHKGFACPASTMVLIVCIMSPSVASSFGSYAVTRWETQKCSDLWVLLETGKVVDRSPARGKYGIWPKVCMP